MLENLQSILTALALAGVCAIGAWLLKTRKQQILAVVTNLVQEAETAIQGTGLGAEKKTKVIAQLEAMGVTVNTWLSEQIDNIVSYLNFKSAWFTSSATSEAGTVIQNAAGTAVGAVETVADKTTASDTNSTESTTTSTTETEAVKNE